jgi:hypothetical protein
MANMDSVYDQLVAAREEGLIPWHWIVDETRDLEIGVNYASRKSAYETLIYNYAHPLWESQKHHCEIWSEKGTIRGLIKEILDEYRLGLRVLHGYTSATSIHEVITEMDIDRPLIVLYIGDHDPSGCDMRERDLAERTEHYKELLDLQDAEIDIRVVALTMDQIREHDLPSIPIKQGGNGKKGDPRSPKYKAKHGDRCWELDALDPRTLRDILRKEVEDLIDWEAWNAAKDAERNAKREFGGAVRRWAAVEDPLSDEIADAIKYAEAR